MRRRGSTKRAVANALIKQGNDLMQNGYDLAEIEEQMGMENDGEARLRVLAGGVVADVGRCMLLGDDSLMRRIRKLSRRIRRVLAKQRKEARRA